MTFLSSSASFLQPFWALQMWIRLLNFHSLKNHWNWHRGKIRNPNITHHQVDHHMIWKVDLPLWYLKKIWWKILKLLKFSTVYALNDQFSCLMFECKFAIISHWVIEHIKPWCQAGFVVNIIELFRIINIATTKILKSRKILRGVSNMKQSPYCDTGLTCLSCATIPHPSRRPPRFSKCLW